MQKKAVQTALGSIVDQKAIKAGKPPVILQGQIDGYVVLTSPEELKQWQEDLMNFHGISLDASGLAGIAGECCCAGRSDMCDIIA